MQKVFGIGFHKTGTSSLAVALRMLGYRVTGPNNVKDVDIQARYLSLAKQLSTEFDAFQDNPWPLVYREMDDMWPDAKFILTVRDQEKWIASQIQHFGDTSTPMRELIYGQNFGSPLGNADHYIQVMNKHNSDVRSYFEDRPGKLLEMDFSKGDGWTELGTFLEISTPSERFPHVNRIKDREQNKLLREVKRVWRKISSRN